MEETERRFQLRKNGKVFKVNNPLWRKKKKRKSITRRHTEEELLLAIFVKQLTQSSSHSFFQ
jgi:hypothetical protein